MRMFLLASVFALSACSAQLAHPVPAAYVSDAQTVLKSYQAAVGIADVALLTVPSLSNPAIGAKIHAIEAQAAPYVAAIQTATDSAAAAQSLGALTVSLIAQGVPYITVQPNLNH